MLPCRRTLENYLRFDRAALSSEDCCVSASDCSETIRFLTTEEIKLSPLLFSHLKLRNAELSSNLHAFLKEQYHQHLAKNALMAIALEEVLSGCNKAGIETMLLKGTAIFCEGYTGLTPSAVVSDMDILVHPRDLQGAIRLLERLGYEPASFATDSTANSKRTFKHPTRLVIVDLHAHLDWIYFSFPRSLENGVWEHARKTTVGLACTHVPSIEHELLIRFLHDVVIGPYSSMLRSLTRLYYFAYQLHAYRTEIDWLRLRALLKSFGVWRAFAAYVLLVEKRLGAPAPEFLLRNQKSLALLEVALESEDSLASESLFHDRVLLLRLDFSLQQALRLGRLQFEEYWKSFAAGFKKPSTVRWKLTRSVKMLREDIVLVRRYFIKSASK